MKNKAIAILMISLCGGAFAQSAGDACIREDDAMQRETRRIAGTDEKGDRVKSREREI